MIGEYYTKSGKKRWFCSFRINKRNSRTGEFIHVKKEGFTRKKDAETYKRKKQNEHETFGYIQNKIRSFDDILEEWFNEEYAIKLAKSTKQDKRYIIDKHLKRENFFSNWDITKIEYANVNRLINEKIKENLSSDYVKKIYHMLHSTFKRAIKMKILKHNPADGIELPSVKNKRRTIWTEEEMTAFLEEAVKDWTYPFFLLALTTGARRGEILGLKWNDINFEKALITLKRSLRREKGEGLLFTDTKTKNSFRTISVPNEVLEELQAHKKRQDAMKEELQGLYEDRDLVISTKLGRPISPRNMLRTIDRLTEKAGVTYITIHDLRHTHSSYLFSEGVNIVNVSRKLGHADPSVTLKVYSHITDDEDTTANVFQSILERNKINKK